MGVMGNTYEETIGMVTAGTEIMVGQPAKVGRGLRTIGINLGAMAKNTDKWVAANGKLNVSLQDQNGDMLSTYDIMSQVADQWDNLTKSEQNAVATQAAGKVLARTGLIDWKLLMLYTPSHNSNILVA